MRAPKLLFAAGLAIVGCTRAYYRTDADRETYSLMADRALAPGSDIGRLRLDPGAGSRLADPFDPDRPPKPPDDPAAAALMAHPYKFRGYSHWGRYGYTNVGRGRPAQQPGIPDEPGNSLRDGPLPDPQPVQLRRSLAWHKQHGLHPLRRWRFPVRNDHPRIRHSRRVYSKPGRWRSDHGRVHQ
jgi:hypothetical protein